MTSTSTFPKSASNSPPPLNNVPLHLVTEILALLDSISDLWFAIHSLDIFESAFKDQPKFVTKSVLTNQIPRELLPFARALYESTRTDLSNPEAAGEILVRLEGAIAEPGTET